MALLGGGYVLDSLVVVLASINTNNGGTKRCSADGMAWHEHECGKKKKKNTNGKIARSKLAST